MKPPIHRRILPLSRLASVRSPGFSRSEVATPCRLKPGLRTTKQWGWLALLATLAMALLPTFANAQTARELRATLRELGVSEDLIGQVAAIAESTRNDVLGR